MPIEIFNWNDTNINFNIYYFTHVCIKRERLFGQQLLQTLLICYNGTMSQPAATFQGFHHLHYIWLLLHLKKIFFSCGILYSVIYQILYVCRIFKLSSDPLDFMTWKCFWNTLLPLKLVRILNYSSTLLMYE